jgi:hypothetical protein
MVFPNFRVLFDWNQSFTYVVTAAYFATRLDGAPVYDAGNPAAGAEPATRCASCSGGCRRAASTPAA